MQKKWQSKVLWVAVLAQVLSILLLTGTIDLTQSELINQVSGSVLQLLVLLGVLNNPNSSEGI